MGGFSGSGAVVSAAIPVTIGNPAAATDFSWASTLTGSLIGIFATLTTSVTVANRFPKIQIATPAGNVIYRNLNPTAQAAGATVNYTFALGIQENVASGEAGVSLPSGLIIAPNWVISSSTVGIQAGDQWSSICFVIANPL